MNRPRFSFSIAATDGKARTGAISMQRGDIRTPAFMPVGTAATVKAMKPADVRAGDYIEIGMLGAYGNAMRTEFNGFGVESIAQVADEPMASLYREEEPAPRRSNVVQLRR